PMTKGGKKNPSARELAILHELEKKVLWLASWTIHHANHLRENVDGVKVGGHQASSASLATIMTALYFHALRPQDRVAVKPHASPIYHAIEYLLDRQTRQKLEDFRGYKGAQSYPSRSKDGDDVDFSTGSVGLGVAQTLFSSLVQDYVRAHGWGLQQPEGRMIALVGDAELDEGNIFEAILEGWKQGLRNCWWIIDYNRQSLDAVIREGLWERYEALFKAFGWDVVILKYGALLQRAFRERGGERLRQWIDSCPNQLYSALVFQGGAAWRKRLLDEIGDQGDVTRLIGARQHDAARIEVPAQLPVTIQPVMSTQAGFGALLNELGREKGAIAERVVTASPDVTVSTNLGPWVNRRGLFAREKMADTFKSERIPSTFNWDFSPKGQHIELGIAEMNLFILLSALGLSHAINGERLIPIGTLYDPFIQRGLDALNYACYQDARFVLAATPSGITLAPEGGAHQSIATPL